MSPTPIAAQRTLRPTIFRRSVEPIPRWVRVRLGGEIVAESKRAIFVILHGQGGLPTYCFPAADVRPGVLAVPARRSPLGGIVRCSVRVGDQVAENAASIHLGLSGELSALSGYVSFDWEKMDEWHELDGGAARPVPAAIPWPG